MKEKIAIIGSGISGLTCAWLLRDRYDVHLYEAGDYLGGHTQTTDVEAGGKFTRLTPALLCITTGPIRISLN